MCREVRRATPLIRCSSSKKNLIICSRCESHYIRAEILKRDGLTSAGDKSSGAKSASTSSPADTRILPVETRDSHSSPSECASVGFLSEAREDRDINKDAFLQQEAPPSVSMLEAQLNEKSIELEAQVTDNQVLQQQLNQKTNESKGLEETITALKQEVSDAHDLKDIGDLNTETENTTINDSSDMLFQQAQAFEIDQLKETVNKLTESNVQLEAENKILAEESSYAKELAAEAAVELKALTEEIMKLMNHNEKLSAELTGEKHSSVGRKTMGPTKRKKEQSPTQLELKRELALSKERELAYEDILSEKYNRETELQEIVNQSKQREAYLENEVANMWILIAKLKGSQEDGSFEI
nr:kinesin-like protein KIN-7K, chloroplastic [Tanacetum cinerariifolium]